MRVLTDDEVYRVNAVWLGPERMTLPFRVRYVAWGVGVGVWLIVFALLRHAFGLGVFVLAWSLVITVAVTRLVCRYINLDKPLGAVLVMFGKEAGTPRRAEGVRVSAAGVAGVRVRRHRPAPVAAGGGVRRGVSARKRPAGSVGESVVMRGELPHGQASA